MDTQIESPLPKKWRKYIYIIVYAFLAVSFLFYFLISAPFTSVPIAIHISAKENLTTISNELKDKNVIRYTKVLKAFVYVFKNDKQIASGDYFFEKNSPVWKVGYMLAFGIHNINPIKITFQEGLTNDQVAEILSKNLPNFNKDQFLSDVSTKQGYLFPDTYFFFPLSTNAEIEEAFYNNFNKRVSVLNPDISKSKNNFKSILVMASILEREARGESDNALISGILWKRIALKMPLQVDAAPDTYKIKGLPSLPISNPGLISIKAALYPKDSSYLFYLHDKTGMVHFANTFAEHKANIKRYLK